jgi:EmrB/QacA subfamily drug resistance transporter
MSTAPSTPAAAGAPGAAGAPVTTFTHRQILVILGGLMSGMFLAALDMTIVSTAIRTIADDLHGLSIQAWATTAYLITSTIATPLYGKLSDLYGRRRFFILAISLFVIGSALSGLAQSMYQLAAFRAFQGLGAGGLFSLALAIIGDIVPPRERARYQGYFLAVFGTSSVLGPVVGGFFAGQDTLLGITGWRWVFLLNVPLALLCVPIAARHVPESAVGGEAHGAGFDVLGATLGALSLAFVTYALIEAGTGSLPVTLTAIVGVVTGVAFVHVERRRPDPMMPPQIFASRQFTAVNIVTLFVYAAISGFFFLAALQLQVVSGYSALGAGTALLPITALMLLLSSRAGALGERIGPRIPLTVGPLLCAAGVLLMLRVGTDASYATDVLPALLVLGLGMVTLVAPLTATVLASVTTEHAGLASGINNAAARAAGLVAIAALPLLAGMGPEAYRSPAAFDSAFDRAMPLCATALVVAAIIAFTTVRRPSADCRHPECRTHCGVTAPPLETGAEPDSQPPDRP